jgi:multiple sugar transport system substrate-binding protein
MNLKRFVVIALLLAVVTASFAGSLVINANTGDPEPKRVIKMLVEKFEGENPDIDVTLNIFSHEDFKTLLRTWLGANEGPDVVTWMAGERMRYFAEKGLIAPITDVFAGSSFDNYFPKSFEGNCSYDGKVYMVPESWYWWGVYYKKSMFEEYGVTPPTTWEEFKAVCQLFADEGIVPITIGTKYLWTAAAWFDLLNMRVHGLDWYLGVLDGDVAYNDPKIKETMSYWQELVDAEYFLFEHSSLSWQEALNRQITDDAAMYLMGQFIKDSTPEDMREDMDFFRFPIIKEEVGLYEETPIDGWMMPANGKNKAEAVKWLQFIASDEVQTIIATELGRLAANKNVPAPDAHAQKGLDMILASDGVMNFYDRDTNPDMAGKAMNGMVQFMDYPEMLDEILDNLETERQRIYE